MRGIGKTKMAAKLRNFQFLSKNARNLIFIRRDFQSVKYGHRKYSSRAVSRSNSGVMTALGCSRNTPHLQQNPCFPAGGTVSLALLSNASYIEDPLFCSLTVLVVSGILLLSLS